MVFKWFFKWSDHLKKPFKKPFKNHLKAFKKQFFLLKVSGQLQLRRVPHCCLLYSEETDRRSTFDRSVLVCRRKSWEKNLAGTQPHARVLSPKFGETNCENPFACEHTLSRGPSALYFLHETHAKRQKSTFPTSRMGVARGCGPHLSAFRLKKLQIYLTFSGWEGWVGLFGLFPT